MSDVALCFVHCYLQHNNRSLKISTFMAELKAGKQRALDLLSHIPHAIPHRKVGILYYNYYFCFILKYITHVEYQYTAAWNIVHWLILGKSVYCKHVNPVSLIVLIATKTGSLEYLCHFYIFWWNYSSPCHSPKGIKDVLCNKFWTLRIGQNCGTMCTNTLVMEMHC